MTEIISIACDHAAFKLKKEIVLILERMGSKILDRGTEDESSVDYPDFAALVAQDVQSQKAVRGILLCGTGVGMAISANKFSGVRAAAIVDEYSLLMARKHNDLNILCLGSRVIGPGTAALLVETFLNTPFEGGRHEERVKKMMALEKTNS